MSLLDRIRLLDPRTLKGPTLAHLKKVEDENALLRQHAAKQITDATLMTGISLHDGSIHLGLKGGAAAVLAECLTDQFMETGAPNYVELTFVSTEKWPGQRFTVTVQRCDGETPSEQIKKLKAELSAKP